MKISEDLKTQIRNAKKADPTLSGSKLGKMFGVHKATANDIVQDLQTQFLPEAADQLILTETSEVKGDTWEVTLPRTPIHTLEALLEYCEVDQTVWSVDKFTVNKWEMGAKNDEGKVDVTPLYQVKAFLKRKREIADAQAEIEALRVRAREQATPPKFIKPKNPPSDNMLEINCPDLHSGKLAWTEETGDANYDTKLSVSIFWKALNTLLHRVREHTFSEVLFVIGNDLLNADNTEGTTTAGTYVTTDARYQKTFIAVRDMKIQAIELLRQIAPVKVVVISGNHDAASCWHLGDSLSCYFHKYPDVTVDNTPLFRKYHEFGKVMLAFCHGHKGKRNDYPLTIATEQPEMFGRTKFREVHTGHMHTLQVNEQHGVRVRILSALCPPDSWHSQNHYIGNLRSAEAFVWNKNEGLIGTAIYNETGEN